jgi:hypothetical protein
MLRAKGTIKKSVSVAKLEKIRMTRADGGQGNAGRTTEIYKINVHYEGGVGPPSVVLKTTNLSPEFYAKRV